MAGKTVSARSAFSCNYQAGLIVMTIKINKSKNHCTIKIDGDLTIYQMAEYHGQLVEKCNSATSATVELSDDSELDAAGIQLLISLQKQLQAAGGDLTLQTTGEQSTKVIEMFNLSRQFKSSEGVN
jgi:anti-anti-sigma factor